MWVPVSDPYDQLAKGLVDRDAPEDRRRVNDQQIAWFDSIYDQGRVSRSFNWALFFNADSRFPEVAGLSSAIVGSFYVLLVCISISLPLGVAAAIYLEEFAPKNRITDLIEVNINNLAAVPSIVFGLLGLAVFIQIFGLPRSAPLVGGLVLALMTLPTIIIVTRNALKAVPPSIREAGVRRRRLEAPGDHASCAAAGAARHHDRHDHRHVHAIGETAPLLLIGMNAFITSPPGGILDASTTLADPGLHLGRQSRARLRLADLCRHPGAARLSRRL